MFRGLRGYLSFKPKPVFEEGVIRGSNTVVWQLWESFLSHRRLSVKLGPAYAKNKNKNGRDPPNQLRAATWLNSPRFVLKKVAYEMENLVCLSAINVYDTILIPQPPDAPPHPPNAKWPHTPSPPRPRPPPHPAHGVRWGRVGHCVCVLIYIYYIYIQTVFAVLPLRGFLFFIQIWV
jgi:hypothetical protein